MKHLSTPEASHNPVALPKPAPLAILGAPETNLAEGPALDLLLQATFADEGFRGQIKAFIKDFVQKNGLKLKDFKDYSDLLRALFRDSIQWEGSTINYKMIEQAAQFFDYEKKVIEANQAFQIQGKPNPDGIFWPNPERNPGQSIYTVLPVVRNWGWINPTTPITSAGSCFASELAFALQQKGLNYLVAEKPCRPEEGVMSSDVHAELGIGGASANWGILFNTPSFAQLAEVAFGEKELPRLLIKTVEGNKVQVTSPFRENIFFSSEEAYERDQPKHLEAVRRVLTTAEVMVITPGVNECWKMFNKDIYLSRNPRSSGLSGLLQHKTLSVQENVDALQRFIDVVRAHNPSIKFVVSVSPVPLIATGRGHTHHVISANGHTKAVIRVAVEEICLRNKDVVYFPGFELITQCTRNPYQEDGRHVSRDAVGRIMSTFDSMFVRMQ
jgi:hypothetical protein